MESKRLFLKRILIVLMLAAVMLQPVFVLAENDKTNTSALRETGEAVKCGTGTLIAPVGDLNAEPPKITAKGAALYSLDMDRIVYGKNENERLEPYSTTKLLTCWLALENLDPDQTVTVSEAATQSYENGTTIWLKAGEKITVRDLIYGAMLESGNDAAYALGEVVAGSEAGFADLMNKTVAEWGCADTHFVNANGWKHAEHYSTAHDMAIITAKCLSNKVLAEIAMTKNYTASATNLSGARDMKNYFLYVAKNPESLTGGKTGTWEDDDCAIVATFSEGGLTEAAVLLEDTEKGRPKDLRTLINFSHEVTPGFAVPAAGAVIDTAWVKHGEKTRLDLVSDGTTYAYPAKNSADEITAEVKYDKLEAPISKGQEVGEILIYSNENLVGAHKLIASEDIATGWLPSYIYISNQMTLNIIKVLVAIAVLIILLKLIRGKRNKTKREKKNSGTSGNRSGNTSPERRKPEGQEPQRFSAKEKREARKRLREKYRGKH